jgi:hypothetical protein
MRQIDADQLILEKPILRLLNLFPDYFKGVTDYVPGNPNADS